MSWLLLQFVAAMAMTSLAACLVTEENEIKWQVGVVEREQVASG